MLYKKIRKVGRRDFSMPKNCRGWLLWKRFQMSRAYISPTTMSLPSYFYCRQAFVTARCIQCFPGVCENPSYNVSKFNSIYYFDQQLCFTPFIGFFPTVFPRLKDANKYMI